MSERDFYRLSTSTEPFMKTQKENNGYTSGYAQLRIHSGTHVDFPPHVGIDGTPRWNLSGGARIVRCCDDLRPLSQIMFFDTGGESLPDDVIAELAASDVVQVVGTDHFQVGDHEAHETLLSSSVHLVENLVNLDEPPCDMGYAYCFAMVIDGCDDGAVLSVAFEPKE